jgi:acyl-CoA dehydrogenase
MTDFQRSPRELDLEQRTREFIRDVVIPCETDPRFHGEIPDELIQDLRRKARDAGLLAPQVAPEWGGHGLDHRETATVFRAAGYSLLGPLAMNCMAPDEGNMFLLERVASAAQKEQFLKPLAAGLCRSAFLMTEPDGGAGSDPSMLTTTATPDGDDWLISGRKWFITGAVGAAFGIVMARTGNQATMFLLPLPAPGLTIGRVMGSVDHTMPGGHSVVRLDRVRVPRSMVLGELHEGFRYAQVRLAPARLTHCMRWLGQARRANDAALAHARQRQAFGRPLGEHEGVGFMLADNHIDLQTARLHIWHTAWLLDQGERGNFESSRAKVVCSEALWRVADRSVQVLGGQGVTGETIAMRIFMDMRAFRIYDGPSEVHRWSLARKLLAGDGAGA